ncbi:MAG TPA: CPBP family intramembrane glutamic endopeptidase [Puia sp.]|nr:CPBP family intramembrane glutamic endopeptidase [Puia sp.]
MALWVHRVKGDGVSAIEVMKGEWLWAVILMSFVGSMTVTYLFRRRVDRKSFLSLGLDLKWQRPGLIAGAALGFGMLGLGTIVLKLTGYLKWTDIVFDGRSMAVALVSLMLVAIYEEVLFRGYILSNLLESFQKWVAVLIAAALFTLFHLGNPGFDLISVMNIFAIGVLLGLYYAYTNQLGFCIAFHFIWNFFEGPVLGYPVSGLHFDSLLQMELKNNALVTGGLFGFEGSLIATSICLLALIFLYSQLERRANRQSIPAPGQK